MGGIVNVSSFRTNKHSCLYWGIFIFCLYLTAKTFKGVRSCFYPYKSFNKDCITRLSLIW